MRYVIREKFFHLGEDSVITDDAGTPRFQVDGKLFSLHDQLLMRDMAGNEVAEIHRKLIALAATYEIERKGVEVEMRKQLFSPFIDRYTVNVPGPDDLSVAGSLFEHEYTFQRAGTVIATVSKQWIALTATYGVEIAAGEDDVLILACVLALDLAEDREQG